MLMRGLKSKNKIHIKGTLIIVEKINLIMQIIHNHVFLVMDNFLLLLIGLEFNVNETDQNELFKNSL